MTIAIMQPYLFPYIGYFQLLDAVDKFIIYDDVNFIKKGWINRNYILINGQPSLFTIPLKNGSQNELISNVVISYNTAWQNKLLKTLEFSYKKAPFYDIVYPLITRIILSDNDFIKDLAYRSLVEISQYLGINTEIIPSSTIYDNRELKGQDRILDICLQNQANTYINPNGGKSLYEESFFKQKEINLFFHQSNPIAYKQFSHDFVPWLSIIDVLMFNPVDAIKRMLDDYQLH